MRNTVRDHRLQLQLSQTELAERAGVTRQLVGAIEMGRHAPGVDAALRIARVLQVSVEDLFAASQPSASVSITDEHTDPEPGIPVIVSRVGDQRVFAPVRNLLSNESWAVVDGFTGEGDIEVLPDTDDSGFLVAGCDPLLGMASAVVARQGGPRIVPIHLSTDRAIDALARGVVHGVVVHGPSHLLRAAPVDVHRCRFASWRVGIASPANRGLASVEQLAERRLRTAQREDGAGSQRALQRALERVGAKSLPGPRVDGHFDAARHVVAGVAAGVTMEAAAAAFGLHFFALETHQSELWIDSRRLGHRGSTALLNALTDRSLVQRARHLPGYDVADMGTEVRAS